jgi:hypothetical protein
MDSSQETGRQSLGRGWYVFESGPHSCSSNSPTAQPQFVEAASVFTSGHVFGRKRSIRPSAAAHAANGKVRTRAFNE